MNRIKLIIEDSRFKDALCQVNELEQHRIFCRHGVHHLLDVARIAWIYILEQGLDFDKSVVYAAGLLHDIAKYRQYTEKLPHHIGSAQLAQEILVDAGYTEAEIELITSAILSHRKLSTKDETSLNYILYMADKRSRNCWQCAANAQCDWPEAVKNQTVVL